MGATLSEQEKEFMDMPYAIKHAEEQTGQKCAIFRNFEAIEKGHLVERENMAIKSLWQSFE